jgi:hypothetical protein
VVGATQGFTTTEAERNLNPLQVVGEDEGYGTDILPPLPTSIYMVPSPQTQVEVMLQRDLS